MSNYTQYQDATDTTSGSSPIIWADCPTLEIEHDPGRGFHFFDDFTNFAQHISDQDTQQYASYIDTGVTLTQLPAVINGQMQVAGNDADNDEGILATHGPLVQVSTAAPKKLWFECRIKKASIADNAMSVFVGLAFDHGDSVPLSSANTLVDNTGSPGSFSFLGFHNDAANGDAIDFMYRAEGQAQTVGIAGVAVPVADTYVKLGFVYDPNAENANKVTVYVNGTKSSTYITQTQLEAAVFPDAEPLGLLLSTKVGAAAESKVTLDWWRVAQER